MPQRLRQRLHQPVLSRNSPSFPPRLPSHAVPSHRGQSPAPLSFIGHPVSNFQPHARARAASATARTPRPRRISTRARAPIEGPVASWASCRFQWEFIQYKRARFIRWREKASGGTLVRPIQYNVQPVIHTRSGSPTLRRPTSPRAASVVPSSARYRLIRQGAAGPDTHRQATRREVHPLAFRVLQLDPRPGFT
jgi:hypothetical protein